MKTILVVDDELAIAESLALILEDEGYAVWIASNGRRGLERLEQGLPDLIILDFVMPIMSGAEMGTQVREKFPGHPIKIIMNSSIEEPSIRNVFKSYDAFIRKPYTVRQLLSTIERLLAV